MKLVADKKRKMWKNVFLVEKRKMLFALVCKPKYYIPTQLLFGGH
jgi:hypothetical protein